MPPVLFPLIILVLAPVAVFVSKGENMKTVIVRCIAEILRAVAAAALAAVGLSATGCAFVPVL